MTRERVSMAAAVLQCCATGHLCGRGERLVHGAAAAACAAAAEYCDWRVEVADDADTVQRFTLAAGKLRAWAAANHG